jgi:two-component system, OmpR family, response regulator
MRLLLLEDDALLGEGLRDFLQAESHVVEWCSSLAAARAIADEPFDALLVDWQLRDGSGLEWLRSRRAQGDQRPALMITARDLLRERVQGLDAGADDYLVKPFEPEELVARLRAVMRRSPQASPAVAAGQRPLEVASVRIDLVARAVRDANGQPVELTAREWALLEALARRLGRIVSKVELDRLVLGLDAEVHSNALEVHVSSLRRKLGRSLIDTVRGLGYRMPAP